MSIADLPALNASLNAICTVLLISAWLLIRRRRIDAHRRTMLAAFATSCAFLTSYVVYHAHAGSKPFGGTGAIRTFYFIVLVSHVILAAGIVPLVLITLRRGLRRDDVRHRRIARWTLPLWLYVSVTGVVIYLMLYRM